LPFLGFPQVFLVKEGELPDRFQAPDILGENVLIALPIKQRVILGLLKQMAEVLELNGQSSFRFQGFQQGIPVFVSLFGHLKRSSSPKGQLDKKSI
jgi:hypothetical protein